MVATLRSCAEAPARIALAASGARACDPRVVGGVRVRQERPEPQAAVRQLLEKIERQAADVDQPRRRGHVVFHQIDQVGAARQHRRPRLGERRQRLGEVRRPGITESIHERVPASTASIASAMLV